MEKKCYFAIGFCQLILPLSLFFPILRITETRVGIGGRMTQIVNAVNITRYLDYDIYRAIGRIMIAFMVLELVGAVCAFIEVFLKKHNEASPKLMFMISFIPAIMGALQIDSGAVLFVVLCAVSFVVSSFCSIVLMRRDS